MHLFKILFVLCRGRCPETNGIAEIVKHGARHNRIEIDDRARFVRLFVHEYIVQLRIVMRDPKGQTPVRKPLGSPRIRVLV